MSALFRLVLRDLGALRGDVLGVDAGLRRFLLGDVGGDKRLLLRAFTRDLRGRFDLWEGEFCGRERRVNRGVDLGTSLLAVPDKGALGLALAPGPTIEDQP